MRDFLDNEDGFSLLELLVAMAILSLAIVPMIGNQGASLRNASRLQEKELAMMVAENVAVSMTVQANAPDVGFHSGTSQQGGINYQWSADSRHVPGQEMMMISIEVKKADATDILARLTTARGQK